MSSNDYYKQSFAPSLTAKQDNTGTQLLDKKTVLSCVLFHFIK